jgi:hypothetical protein
VSSSSRRRLRPTFLLNCVLTLVVFGLAVGALFLVNPVLRAFGAVPLSSRVALWLLVGAVVLWFLVIDFGAAILGSVVARRANSLPSRVVERWFIDLDAAESEERAQRQQGAQHNPAIW